MSGWLGEQDARRDAIATGGKTGTNEILFGFRILLDFSFEVKEKEIRRRKGKNKQTFHDKMIKINEIERTNTNGKTVREMTTESRIKVMISTMICTQNIHEIHKI